jgi:OmpA-OmpF porin, OOP family
MKQLLLAFLSGTLFVNSGAAQTIDSLPNTDYKRPAAIGISFIFNDYATAQRIRSTSLSRVLSNKQWGKLKNMSPGIAVTYFKGVHNTIDFAGTLASSFVEDALPEKQSSNNSLLLEGDASLNFKMLSDRYVFSPYLSAGISASKYRSYYGASLPLGGGLKFNLYNEAAVFITAKYHIPVTTETAGYHFVYGLGVAGTIGAKKEAPVKAVPIPQAPKDTDGDGITDDKDKCVDTPGVAKYEGCPVPDTDKDGINDEADQCPTVAGVAKYNGCPIPDTDGDGVNDEEDKCKDVAGVARLQGCPVPDTDGDGLNDEEDKCPQLPGTRENNGCPEVKQEVVKRVEYAARNVYFITGSYKLSSKSFVPLNGLVKILNDDKDLKLSIEGHTDNVGADDYNQTLSENRAASVKQYLVSKGIDESRLTSQGFGETQPVADNKTAAGRAKNRRVVMTVSYQ